MNRRGKHVDQAMDMAVVAAERIVKLGYAYREAKALLSAVELGVFTALAEGPLDLDTLGSKISVHPRGARDFFDALVALGLIDRDHAGRYRNTPATALYLDRRKPTYLGGELEFINTHLYAHWNSLTATLKTGRPQSGAQAAGHYAARYSDSTQGEIFVKAMTAATLWVARALAVKFPWRDYRTVIDIGTAEGCLPVQIAQMHPHITGGGLDLPPIKPLFENYVQEQGLTERLHFHPGDFFQDPMPSADVLVMGRVLHNWDLATKKMLLTKAYDALSAGGALLVYERLIDDERRVNTAGLLASLNMLIMTEGGFDFTGADCIGWMREARFRDIRMEPLTTEQSMVVGFK
jgi:O-methyltransferase/methyltransferase family protein